MYCKECGKEIADDSKFCSFCGKAQMAEKELEMTEATEPAKAETGGCLSSFAGIAGIVCFIVGLFALMHTCN